MIILTVFHLRDVSALVSNMNCTILNFKIYMFKLTLHFIEAYIYNDYIAGADPEFCNGGGLWQRGGGARYMLNHRWCAVGPLHSQKILNFGVSWGEALKPPKPPTGSATALQKSSVHSSRYLLASEPRSEPRFRLPGVC